ncbi:hypothetical protein ElyMa_003632300 [Elysia marginata]|uniref:Uncharacterized protein n=1 Tax=Elysia marginata TaxID=1093978 RepID=A0AAV4EUL9_9GAST|nr:hypothetical protein ElyMa_003632300 [Elysia marginata]
MSFPKNISNADGKYPQDLSNVGGLKPANDLQSKVVSSVSTNNPVGSQSRLETCQKRNPTLREKSSDINSEALQVLASQEERSVSTSTDNTNVACVSPPGHLHDNKWAQIILRARQRQVLNNCDSFSQTNSVEASGDRVGTECSGVANIESDSDGKLAPQKLVEMWFSKKRPPKQEQDLEEVADVSVKDHSCTNVEEKNSAQESAASKPRLFGRNLGSDKKQLSLGKMLAKREEKETEEDQEFKKQCRLELEKRLSECGFGIHAPAKERLDRGRKTQVLKKNKHKSFDASSQTELPCDQHDTDLPPNEALSSSAEVRADVSCDSGLETRVDLVTNSEHEHESSKHCSSSKTRSLPEDLRRRGVGKKSASHMESTERFSTASLQLNSPEQEFQKPAPRARSLLDTFRDFASKSLWKKSQRHLSSRELKSPSTLDLITNDSIASHDGTAGKDSSIDDNGLKSSASEIDSEESKASVLKQNAVVRGNVLRSVVFYQNRFIVMDQTKPGRNKTSNLDKKTNPEGCHVKNDNKSKKDFAFASKKESHNYVCVLNNQKLPEATPVGKLQTSSSFTVVENRQPILTLPSLSNPHTILDVDKFQTSCLKSESDLELDLYYSRNQHLSLQAGRSRSSERNLPRSQTHGAYSVSGHRMSAAVHRGDMLGTEHDGEAHKHKHAQGLTVIGNNRKEPSVPYWTPRGLLTSDCSTSKTEFYRSEPKQTEEINREKSASSNNKAYREHFLDFDHNDEEIMSARRQENCSRDLNEDKIQSRISRPREKSRSRQDNKRRDYNTSHDYQESHDTEDIRELKTVTILPTDDEQRRSAETPSYRKDRVETYRDLGRGSRENKKDLFSREQLISVEVERIGKARSSSKELENREPSRARIRDRAIKQYSRDIMDGVISPSQRESDKICRYRYNYSHDIDSLVQNEDEHAPHSGVHIDEHFSNLPSKCRRTAYPGDFNQEPSDKGHRSSKNVQFQDERQAVEESRLYGLHSGVKDPEDGGRRETNHRTPATHKSRSQTVSPIHPRHTDRTLYPEEFCKCDDPPAGLRSRRQSRSADGNTSEYPDHFNEYRYADTHRISQQRHGNRRSYSSAHENAHERSRQSHRLSNPDEALTPPSPHHNDVGELFLTSQTVNTSAELDTAHTNEIYRISRRTNEREDHHAVENNQQKEGRSYHTQREYHPSSNDYQLRYRDDQAVSEDSPPNDEEYQPSIKDYQPRRRKYHPSSSEYQPVVPPRNNQESSRRRESPRRRHRDKS